MKTGGRILIDCLLAHDVRHIFGVPGESYLPALDALYDVRNRIEFITCRQEGGAAFMAGAYAKVTGKTGICFVTRGPGVTNASIGLHDAFQASEPMILLIGQAPRNMLEREAFQEIEYRNMLGPLTKWVAQIEQTDRIPEMVTRAFNIAHSGRPGPVALVFPEDVFLEESVAEILPPIMQARSYPCGEDMDQIWELLGGAQHPLIVLGGSGWNAQGRADIHDFAEKNALPVATAFRRQSLFDNDHPCYIGNLGNSGDPHPNTYAAQVDVILALGTRLADATSKRYQVIHAPNPRQKVIHILPAGEELGRVLVPSLAMVADVNACAEAMARRPVIYHDSALADRKTQTAKQRALLEQMRENICDAESGNAVNMGEILRFLRDRLPPDSIVANGAGDFSVYPNQYYSYRSHGSICAPVSGSMGYGIPAAIAAKIAHPERVVVSFSGDGDCLMTGQEIATAMRYQAHVIFIVVNNSTYGTIQTHQERMYPGRSVATGLTNPDFSAFARSFGAHGEVVERTEDFEAAFERAMRCGLPALLEVRT